MSAVLCSGPSRRIRPDSGELSGTPVKKVLTALDAVEASIVVRWVIEEEALLAARLLQGADIELLPTRALFEQDMEDDCRFVTADERFVRKAGHAGRGLLRVRVIGLSEMGLR